MKVIFTCGGTAGHVNPALALARYMQEKDSTVKVLFIGTPNGIERDLVEKAGYDFEGIAVSGFRRQLSVKGIRHNLHTVKVLMAAKAKAEAEGKEWREPPRPSTFKLSKPSSQSEVNPEEDLELVFATPLTRFDSTSFELLSWSDKKDTIREKVSFTADSRSPRKWRMHSRWLPEREYKLYIPTDALADITGEGNDSITLNLTVADIEKFATLKFDVKPRTPEAVYVVQMLDAQNKLIREFQGIGGGKHTINYVPAGEIRIRIIEDMNGHGKWASGNMVERRQSERAEFYKNDKEEELFTTKTGWEFEFTFDMQKIFAPVTMQELIERLDKREMVRLQQEEERRRKAAANKSNESGHNHNNNAMGGMSGMGGLGGMMGGSGSGISASVPPIFRSMRTAACCCMVSVTWL